MAQTPKSSTASSQKPTVIVKEVCCCNIGKKNKVADLTNNCLRRNPSLESKSANQAQSEATIVQKPQISPATEKILWKHIMMKVKHRKRLENGQMGNVVQALNIVSGEKCVLMVDPQLIDNQDIPGLERLLRKNVQLAPSNVSIYLQISEKMLKK